MPELTVRRLDPVPLAAATPSRTAAPLAQAGQREPSVLGKDELKLGTTRPQLLEEVRASERITGKPVAFKNETQLGVYLDSVEAAKGVGQYDRDGFLGKTLGLESPRAPGREDKPTLKAVRAVDDYRPDDEIMGSKLPQQFFFEIAKAAPGLFLFLTKLANPLMEAPGQISGNWKKPFELKQAAHPSDVSPDERYPDAYLSLRAPLKFGEDFHAGLTEADGARPYGTYAIARQLGFGDQQAQRIAQTDNGIDFNTTPYGKTSYHPTDEMDRHFNFDRDHQDTRLVWAANHLQAAIAFGRQGSYDEAEIELGAGLHSLQDLFAHGQLSPAVHATIGEFPDDVRLNPIATYEATLATGAYLRTYLREIAPPSAEPSAEN